MGIINYNEFLNYCLCFIGDIMSNYKSYLKTGLILAAITAICGIMIALLNGVTAPIIEENNYKKEQETLALIFYGATFENLEIKENDSKINKVYLAKVNDEILGYVYLVSGKNAYGTIELMIGISDGSVCAVEIITNTQSFSKVVNQYVNDLDNLDINNQNIEDLDVKCGATYGAKLVKELIKVALDHYQGGYLHE